MRRFHFHCFSFIALLVLSTACGPPEQKINPPRLDIATLEAPEGLQAFDTPGDAGGAITLKWKASPTENTPAFMIRDEIKRRQFKPDLTPEDRARIEEEVKALYRQEPVIEYRIYTPDDNDGFSNVLASFSSGINFKKEATGPCEFEESGGDYHYYYVSGLEDGRPYRFRVELVMGEQTVPVSALDGSADGIVSASSRPNWFAPQKLNLLITVVAYCCYAPTEMIYAMGGIPVGLCGMSQSSIPVAEKTLPANTCPLVKSSFGFIESGTCPFFESADAVIAETTCDAKKKMFEYIGRYKPFHLIELPQIPERAAAVKHWIDELKRLKAFLEDRFRKRITKKRLEAAIKTTNRRRRLRRRLYDYTKTVPPVISGGEIHRLFDVYAAGDDHDRHLEKVLEELERRKRAEEFTAGTDAPRVMMSGCPLGGDAEKVIEEIEGAGGVIVVNEACSGIKPLLDLVEEDTGDPLRAVAERYLKLPCSVMTPNERRLEVLDALIAEFKPDCVIDVILTACHTYNLESHKIMERVQKKHGLPFLKIETDYADADRGQMRVRIEALMEMVRER